MRTCVKFPCSVYNKYFLCADNSQGDFLSYIQGDQLCTRADGFDSNGAVYMNGGTVVVNGPAAENVKTNRWVITAMRRAKLYRIAGLAACVTLSQAFAT